MNLQKQLRKQLKNKGEIVMSKNIKNLNLSSPWVVFYREIEKMFEKDNAIKIILDEDNHIIKLYVEGTDKAMALSRLLPTEKTFGNITVKVQVIPANNEDPTDEELFKMAFEGNNALAFVANGNNEITRGDTYVVFSKEVVQYYNDSLSDLNGICSTLYQDIAKDIFGTKTGLHFCTNNNMWYEL